MGTIFKTRKVYQKMVQDSTGNTLHSLLLVLPVYPTLQIDRTRSNQCQHEPNCFRVTDPYVLSPPEKS